MNQDPHCQVCGKELSDGPTGADQRRFQQRNCGAEECVPGYKERTPVMTKRLSYEQIRISTIGGIIECKPATEGGWAIAFHANATQPRVGYGKSIEEAGQKLVNDLRYTINAVEEDLKALAERNK